MGKTFRYTKNSVNNKFMKNRSKIKQKNKTYMCPICKIENCTECIIKKSKINKFKYNALSNNISEYNVIDYDITNEELKYNGLLLKHIYTQTEEQCLIAVKQNPNALLYSIYKTEPILIAALKQKGSLIQYVKKQTEKLCKIALNQDPNALKFINYQTEEMIVNAIKKSAYTIKFIKNPSVELYKKLIDINLNSYHYIDEEYIDENFKLYIWTKILYKNGMNLIKCKTQTLEICKIAIEQNPHAIQYINKSSFSENDIISLFEIAIVKDPHTIKYIKNYYFDLIHTYSCMYNINLYISKLWNDVGYCIMSVENYIKLIKLALSYNGLVIKYIIHCKCIPYEIYKLSVEQNPDAVMHIKNKYYRNILNNSLYIKSTKEIDDCMICMSSNEYFIKKYRCSHIYCRDCMHNSSITKCPLCRESRKEKNIILIKK